MKNINRRFNCCIDAGYSKLKVRLSFMSNAGVYLFDANTKRWVQTSSNVVEFCRLTLNPINCAK